LAAWPLGRLAAWPLGRLAAGRLYTREAGAGVKLASASSLPSPMAPPRKSAAEKAAHTLVTLVL